ncbi:FkbM family methyltransferase [Nitrincola sp.]|uniref:FkbM family methyltransferase n=1 Tax=Nitrincola sp. TaxID=1926584 RepID=UPI003A8D2177
MSFDSNYAAYLRKLEGALKAHDLIVESQRFEFTASALASAKAGDWNGAAVELRDLLQQTLSGKLSASHEFLDHPYVRCIDLTAQEQIFVAIVNNQSREWYGTETAISAFDFLLEDKRGLFQNCRRFLDLGGHQLVWTCFYARRASDAQVVSYEPSILNVVIGLFNCLVNGVVERVDVVPFAVLASNATPGDGDEAKMLVDYMTVPLRARCIDERADGLFDFIKTDIEGYEFELLNDPVYLNLVKHAQTTCLELHLGHLVGRGVNLQQWVERLQAANIHGTELHSEVEMYEFLGNCDPNGFHCVLVKAV